jgi:hypothetical protein
MASTNKGETIFQNLTKTINGYNQGTITTNVKTDDTHKYTYDQGIILKTTDKEAYEKAKLTGRQDKWLSNRWWTANTRTNINELQNMSLVDLMYRDVELMSYRPEIYQALNIASTEACTLSPEGSLINVYSKSDRIKVILEDLFVNRLQIHLTLLPTIRQMLKYGNAFKLLNINSTNGILGWKELPVTEMKRFENQYSYGFAPQNFNGSNADPNKLTPHFEWVGQGTLQKFQSWEIAHFRLLNDTIFLPYGTSFLHGARQHWRRLTLMEDAMLIYILEKAFERFVYRVEVGGIDPTDVEAHIQNIATQFKRSIKVDPETGMLDLSKQILTSIDDIFIPVRGNNDASKVETLSGGGNLDKIKEMLDYVHHQMLTALGTPKVFLNFEASPAEGRNLSMVDVRYAKSINRVQQCTLMELNKMALIHLYLLGFADDLNNFTITMNNPSTQNEILRVEELQKKILAVKDAVSGATEEGLSVYSWKKALKDIMKFSDAEIHQILMDLRLEKILGIELKLTEQIIKRTGVFDEVDLLYGDKNAKYDFSGTDVGQTSGGVGGGGGGGLGMDDFGGSDMAGETEGDPLDGGDTAEPTPSESLSYFKSVLNEERNQIKLTQNVPQFDVHIFNEEYNRTMDEIDRYLKESIGKDEITTDTEVLPE